MEIQTKLSPNSHFKSRNNPVKPFELETSRGTLKVQEFTNDNANIKKEIRDLAKFFLDGFISNTDAPWFVQYKNPANKEQYLKCIDTFSDYYKDMFCHDDGNLTVLVAKNDKNKICGAIVTNTLNEAGVFEPTTCYVDSIAVAAEYRKNGIGSTLMQRAIDCSKDVYTDVFLASNNKAVPFELKNGYRILNYDNPLERKIIDIINAHRQDYPEYTTFMDKKLRNHETNKPWYERIQLDYFNFIDKINSISNIGE